MHLLDDDFVRAGRAVGATQHRRDLRSQGMEIVYLNFKFFY
jgi:hypothetical protein